MSDRRFNDATLAAEKLVRDENLKLPVDILALAERRGILVEAKPESAKTRTG